MVKGMSNSRRRSDLGPEIQSAAVALLVLTAVALCEAAPGTQAGRPDGRQSQTLEESLDAFDHRLGDYLRLRSQLAAKLEPLAPTASASELAARQESLAAALRSARKSARHGDLIPPPVAAHLRAIVADDLRSRTAEDRRAALAEIPMIAVVINKTYPAQAALPTVPPLLLKRLPVLPDNLQYRFAGRHMVVLDGDTQIIIDYVENVLPPR
jgi:hypothetical protein